ncbi:restriction endonuclease subunit S [Alteromonas mediterranea]|uniref:restriction endonuclease subunit S n=1 Tax=Alteromonas mediterranea TaxID=314275 RepID=UPI004046E8CB
MGDLFEVETSKKRFDANKVTLLKNGKHPYVVRMGSNNGQKGFIDEEPCFLNEGNTISFGQDTATMFYQEKPYFTGDKIKILKPKDNGFNKRNAQFFISTMIKAFSSFSWGSSSFNVKVIKSQLLTLPIKRGKLDYKFMERFVSQLETEQIAKLQAYLDVAGLNDYQLTPEETSALVDYQSCKFDYFKVIDVFKVKNSGNILSRDIVKDSGETPYLCASRENNSVSSYISYDEKYLDQGNCVFIGGKTFVVTYQESDFYSNDSHNLVLYLKNEKERNKLNQLFLATCVEKSLAHKYSWGDSISNRKIQKDVVALPVIGDKVDFSSMSIIISAVQKLVIRDVVEYTENKITEHEKVLQKA